MQLVLYGRPGCHLCEAMLEELAPLQAELGFALVVRDVDRDPEWARRFGARVPVLTLGDEILSEFFLDADRVRARLA